VDGERDAMLLDATLCSADSALSDFALSDFLLLSEWLYSLLGALRFRGPRPTKLSVWGRSATMTQRNAKLLDADRAPMGSFPHRQTSRVS
jgi:hypothetical protein